MSTQKKQQSGQALLIVLLTMTVVLTVVLSILSRSVTDIAVTSRGEESIRAFSAAEAGVEQAIIGVNVANQKVTGDFDGAEYDTDVVDIGKDSAGFIYPVEIANGDIATIWFVSHNSPGNLVCDADNPCFTGSSMQLCWGELISYGANVQYIPAIEVSVFYTTTPGDFSTTKIARGAYDPFSPRITDNHFDQANSVSCSVEEVDPDGNRIIKTYPFFANISFADLGIPSSVYNIENGLQIATVRLLYNSDQTIPIGVKTASPSFFPSQGQKINSTGISGEAVRRVEALRLFSDLPLVFHSVLFSPPGITK